MTSGQWTFFLNLICIIWQCFSWTWWYHSPWCWHAQHAPCSEWNGSGPPHTWTGWTWCAELCPLLVVTGKYCKYCKQICWLLLFAVENPLLGPFLAVVDDYLVVCTRGYDALPIIAGGVNDQHQEWVGVACQTCSECLWFAPYCPCTAWPPACWKFVDESYNKLWWCDRQSFFLEPFKRNSALSHFSSRTSFVKYTFWRMLSTDYQTSQQRLQIFLSNITSGV